MGALQGGRVTTGPASTSTMVAKALEAMALEAERFFLAVTDG